MFVGGNIGCNSSRKTPNGTSCETKQDLKRNFIKWVTPIVGVERTCRRRRHPQNDGPGVDDDMDHSVRKDQWLANRC